ncbi:hypothetical protein TRVL_04969 [Trypanosoma vivax]|nr:hypothetical protein TRVL_04969 [Trypanosoma vivax]
MCQYLEFHFTPSRVSFAQSLLSIRESFDYPLRVARKFARFKPAPSSRKVKRALDIGCATGASTFVMSKHFDDVIGIDLSQTFIHFAKKVAASIVSGDPSAFKFFAPLQGETMEERCVSVPEGVIAKNCHFFCGDAMHLIEESNGGGNASPTPISFRFDDVSWYQVPRGEKFDGVLCANVLCRVPDPRKLLDTLSHLLYSGGVLVLSSPYSWEDVGNRDKWIGGRHGDPKSEDLVKQILVKDFELLSESDEAFLIRDHCRRYQLGFAHCTVWRRR